MCIATINAIATTVIAALVAIITGGQWITNRSRLRHELFDRRYEIYEEITGFLADVLQSGSIPPGREFDLLRQTKRAYFVFGGDASIEDLISSLYKEAVDLHALQSEESALSGDARKQNLMRQREIKDSFEKALASMEKTFAKHLRLRH